jgi:hypothetical protein
LNAPSFGWGIGCRVRRPRAGLLRPRFAARGHSGALDAISGQSFSRLWTLWCRSPPTARLTDTNRRT